MVILRTWFASLTRSVVAADPSQRSSPAKPAPRGAQGRVRRRRSRYWPTEVKRRDCWGCPLGSGWAGDSVPDVADGRPYPEGQRDLHDAVDDQPDTEHEGQGDQGRARPHDHDDPD